MRLAGCYDPRTNGNVLFPVKCQSSSSGLQESLYHLRSLLLPKPRDTWIRMSTWHSQPWWVFVLYVQVFLCCQSCWWCYGLGVFLGEGCFGVIFFVPYMFLFDKFIVKTLILFVCVVVLFYWRQKNSQGHLTVCVWVKIDTLWVWCSFLFITPVMKLWGYVRIMGLFVCPDFVQLSPM